MTMIAANDPASLRDIGRLFSKTHSMPERSPSLRLCFLFWFRSGWNCQSSRNIFHCRKMSDTIDIGAEIIRQGNAPIFYLGSVAATPPRVDGAALSPYRHAL